MVDPEQNDPNPAVGELSSATDEGEAPALPNADAVGTSAPAEPPEEPRAPEAPAPPPETVIAESAAAGSAPAAEPDPPAPATEAAPAAALAADSTPEAAEPAASAATPDEAAPADPAAAGAAEGATVEAPAAEAPAAGEADAAAAARKAPRKPVATLYRAFRSGRPVRGTVAAVIKGGYEIRLGKLRAFCPHSQIDLHRVEDPEQQVGQTYQFRIVQLRRGGDDVVLSRRAMLEDERREEAKAVRATLIEGAVMRGRVAGLADFGAFVDLGAGVMGLVHVSELSHARIQRVADAVQAGDTVSVKILKIHPNGNKISLSIRQAEPDPWSGVTDRFHPGSVHPGTIRRIADFGAFVELDRGVEALAPASEFPPSPAGWRDGLEAGQQREWLVLAVDPGQRRISLTPPAAAPDGERPIEPGAMLKGQVQRVESYGVFVWLGPGRVGLMPSALSGTPRGTDMARQFKIGEPVEVEVVGIESDGRRIRLARQGAERPAEPARRPERPGRARQEPPPRPARDDSAASAFGTSLGDKLRAALGGRSGS